LAVGPFLDPALPDHVGDPQVLPDLDELDLAQCETFAGAVPGAELALRLRPVPRDRQDEPLAPAADVVAHVGDDLVSLGHGVGRVATQVVHLGHRWLLTPVGATSITDPLVHVN